MGLGASSKLGWTALPLWELQKPEKHKDILVLTIFPVTGGPTATQIRAVAADHISLGWRSPTPRWRGS